ncbi:hypothetical protein MFORT_22320 [Mycolicibacterium fortuitum subsp. fortuitum DSM 46621 = ATCC 6841 = JCM 6387]|uniref:Uncharacterized protein n=1 Tax=Mycolicibacterium fortuitum subsp. fortuitum DSM 46621 = ATCC 6841 = JCM 6387 TaxID=1214102 RepID=K0VEM6_MYCFO|nr:hypothetical protein MFORT_22320 [Mycolicibacterium fortuitum subsp. fortuitum DSM 46621 = ATCC 6841 = JCM 6387]
MRRLLTLFKEEGGGYLDDLAGVAKALRWRCITQPQPLEFNPGRIHLADEVVKHATRLRGAIADQGLLDELAAAAAFVASNNSVIAEALLRSIEEAGSDCSVVVASNKPAATGLKAWLQDYDILVLTAGELERDEPQREHAYVVGSPGFYPSSLVTAPVTSEVSFLLPTWLSDRAVPHSAIAAYAEGAIRIEARIFTEGDTTDPAHDLPGEPEDEKEYLPQPVWGTRREGDRQPTREEVEAHKVLLSGNLAMWLDDGERIRSLDPEQPAGERVTYTEIPGVRVGTYLLLRQGETERAVLYQAAIARLADGAAIDRTQESWKHRLAERIQQTGHREVDKQLRAAGVTAADRARAWTDPNLIRPHSDQDFERLLHWLDIPTQPTFGYATLLRKTLYQVSAEIGKQLEVAVSAADLAELDTTGHLSLDAMTDGFRGILATRVLAISPFTEIVPRHDARVPFEDRSGQWLE